MGQTLQTEYQNIDDIPNGVLLYNKVARNIKKAHKEGKKNMLVTCKNMSDGSIKYGLDQLLEKNEELQLFQPDSYNPKKYIIFWKSTICPIKINRLDNGAKNYSI